MRHQHPNKSRASERGSALVEGALVSGAFLFILIASIDFGQVMFSHQTLTERARAAARWGAAHPSDPNMVLKVQNLVLYNNVTRRESGDTSPTLFGMTTANVDVRRVPGSYGQPDRLTVRLNSYRLPFFTPIIAGTKTGKDIIVAMPMENP